MNKVICSPDERCSYCLLHLLVCDTLFASQRDPDVWALAPDSAFSSAVASRSASIFDILSASSLKRSWHHCTKSVYDCNLKVYDTHVTTADRLVLGWILSTRASWNDTLDAVEVQP